VRLAWERQHVRRSLGTLPSVALPKYPDEGYASLDVTEGPLRVTGGCGRQADGTGGLTPAPEITVRSRTCASCQYGHRLDFLLFHEGHGPMMVSNAARAAISRSG
jgi:hypothetical protein